MKKDDENLNVVGGVFLGCLLGLILWILIILVCC